MLTVLTKLKFSIKQTGCIVVLICTAQLHAEVVYHYEPEQLTITGIVVDMSFPGSPDYDETMNDQLVTVPVVLLNRPIDVFSVSNTESNDPDDQTEKNVQFMQLFSDDKPVKFRGCARLTGSLMHQITAHHYTRVLMNVKQIEKVNTCHASPRTNIPFASVADNTCYRKIGYGGQLQTKIYGIVSGFTSSVKIYFRELK